MALRRGIADALVLDHAVELGVPAPRAQEICAMLATVLCQDAELSTHGYREERLRPDRIALLGLYRKSAKKLLAQRKKNVVQVVGLGRTGAALAGVLANAGVGTLLLEDDSPSPQPMCPQFLPSSWPISASPFSGAAPPSHSAGSRHSDPYGARRRGRRAQPTEPRSCRCGGPRCGPSGHHCAFYEH
ncbi:hypothetical protein NHF46_16525 [Arthrobacter alpinus]|nr:hypothetical protein [Arthrobacter alpinus]